MPVSNGLASLAMRVEQKFILRLKPSLVKTLSYQRDLCNGRQLTTSFYETWKSSDVTNEVSEAKKKRRFLTPDFNLNFTTSSNERVKDLPAVRKVLTFGKQ